MGAPDVVRSNPGPLRRSRAPLDYRLGTRFPRLNRLVFRLVTAIHPRARLRRALLPRGVQLAFSAYERGDYRSPIEMYYAPDVDFEAGQLGEAAPLDLALTVSRREDLVPWLEQWVDSFAWVRWDVSEFLDFGDAVVFAMHQEGAGKASGAVTELLLFSAARFERGQVTWQRFFRDRDQAIRAVGRDPDEIPA
ncbi:MAG TPA: hypothetical protein VHF58_08925 [Solirubrobacterales bacterium]|nr:hypothetical protein [Solirubrobacterales bacterium]